MMRVMTSHRHVPLARILIVASALAGAAGAAPEKAAEGPGFNRSGNLLVSDRLNNRVVELAPDGAIVWQFGKGPADTTASSPLGPRDADRAGELTLIAASGIAAGELPACPQGCPDGRVLLVDRSGKVVWSYGSFGRPGSGAGELDTPVAARYLPGDRILIVDQGNHRVIEVDRKSREITWQHGTGKAGSGDAELSSPGTAEPLPDGTVLIADTGNNRAVEVTRDHQVLRRLSIGASAKGLASATLIPTSGHFLVTDLGYNRVVELDPTDKLVWEGWTYMLPGSDRAPVASRAVPRRNGDLVIAENRNHRIAITDVQFNLVASYGNVGRPGYGTARADEGLSAPFDAKVIGESTGLVTPGPAKPSSAKPDEAAKPGDGKKKREKAKSGEAKSSEAESGEAKSGQPAPAKRRESGGD